MKQEIESHNLGEIVSRFRASTVNITQPDLTSYVKEQKKAISPGIENILKYQSPIIHRVFSAPLRSKLTEEQIKMSKLFDRETRRNVKMQTPVISSYHSSIDETPEKYSGVLPTEVPPGFGETFFSYSPYTNGNPSTEIKVPIDVNWGDGLATYYSLSEFSDPDNGFISLGCLGGNFYWQGERGSPFPYPMTGTWALGDSVSCSANLIHLQDIGHRITKQSTLRVFAYLWVAATNYNEVFYCFPGPNTANANGAVALVGIANIMVNLAGQDWTIYPPGVLGPVNSSRKFMEIIYESDDDNYNVNAVEEYYHFQNGQLLELSVDIPVFPGIQYAIIDFSVNINGYRYGVNDPQGGMVGACFQDRTKTGRMARDFWWIRPTPFELAGIKYCLSI